MTHTACPPLPPLSLPNLKIEWGAETSLLYLNKMTQSRSNCNCLVLEDSRANELQLNSPEYCLLPILKISSQSRKCVFSQEKVIHVAITVTVTQKEMLSSFNLTALLTPVCSYNHFNDGDSTSSRISMHFLIETKCNYIIETRRELQAPKQMHIPTTWNARTLFSVRCHINV